VGIEKFLPACSLAKLHDPRAKDYLLDYLAYAHTRERAFDSLKLLNVQSEELFQAYLRVLQNRDVADWFARQEAAKALVAMDDERAIRPLEALLADHNNTYRDKKDDLNHMDRITIIEALNKLRKKQSKSWKFW
jgi:HEAT repeat protein